MNQDQMYVYKFRWQTASPEVNDSAESRFLTGVVNAAVISVPLWALIIWGVKALF